MQRAKRHRRAIRRRKNAAAGLLDGMRNVRVPEELLQKAAVRMRAEAEVLRGVLCRKRIMKLVMRTTEIMEEVLQGEPLAAEAQAAGLPAAEVTGAEVQTAIRLVTEEVPE